MRSAASLESFGGKHAPPSSSSCQSRLRRPMTSNSDRISRALQLSGGGAGSCEHPGIASRSPRAQR